MTSHRPTTTPDRLPEAKRRLSLSALMAQLGDGDRAKKSALCPFHEDASPSFSIYTGSDGIERWKCHAKCGSGDAVDYLARRRNVSTSEALKQFIELAVGAPPCPPRIPSEARPLPPPASFDWPSCVAAMDADAIAELAKWRGYSVAFVDSLRRAQLVGLFQGQFIALPVHDTSGTAIGCHYRLDDGTWRYHPVGTKTAALVIGDPAQAKAIYAFESPWDLFAVFDRLGFADSLSSHLAAIATRGASNGRLLAGRCSPEAIVYTFEQNDEPGRKWRDAVAASSGCQSRRVLTPEPHKDANDWLRTGVNIDALRTAIDAAKPMQSAPQPSVDLHHPPPSESAEDERDEPPPAPFPVDTLPPTLRALVDTVADSLSVPPALPAICALGVASAALGAGVVVRSGDQRFTRGNLFVLGIAESGSGKSETFRVVAAPLLKRSEELHNQWRDTEKPRLEGEVGLLSREISTLERKAAKAAAHERDALLGEIARKTSRKNEATRHVAAPCIIAQDVTTERLAGLLRDNGEVIFSASADARKLVDNLLGRYNPGKTTDESLYLCAFSGDQVRVDRQGKEPIILNRPCLSLLWLIQPDLLETLLEEKTLSTSGFLPRLLLCHTRAMPSRIAPDKPPINQRAIEDWAELIKKLSSAYHHARNPGSSASAPAANTPPTESFPPPATEGDPQAAPPTRNVDAEPEALACLNEFHNIVVDRRCGDLSDVGPFAARYAENAWRLALVLHASLHGDQAHARPLALETAQNAVRLVEWFASEQLQIIARNRRKAAARVEDELLELLTANSLRKGIDYLTARDVSRARITPTPEAATGLLARMEREGLLLGEDFTPPHGGKTSRRYRAVGKISPEP